MNGAGRLQLGEKHDREAVVPALQARGYQVEEFGQALLSPDVRARLRTRTSLIRWLPDHAVMVPNTSDKIGFIDSKTCTKGNSGTVNHAIEFRSVLGSQITRVPTYYVCSDLAVISSVALYQSFRFVEQLWKYLWPCCDSCLAIFRSGSNELQIADELPEHCPNHRGRGSGTPFVRFPKNWCRDLNVVFPSLQPGAR